MTRVPLAPQDGQASASTATMSSGSDAPSSRRRECSSTPPGSALSPHEAPAPLDLREGPCAAVGDDRVGEELRVPDRRHVARAGPDVRAGETVEELATVRIEERAVGVERA